jgi:branched-chain amino acid aminotransferase
MEMDWKNIGFGYIKTDFNIRCNYADGKWGELEVHTDEYISLHMAATALHYGQESFEGLKAFKGKDGKIRIFRMRDNALRMQDSSDGTLMARVPLEIFEEAVLKAVKLNERFVPPYESGASLYIRPVLFGSGAQVGVKPAKEYMFIVFVSPVGPYFKGGFQTTPFVIMREYDRSAPLGMGKYKVGGNYAASLVAGKRAAELGYSNVFYLDAREKKIH